MSVPASPLAQAPAGELAPVAPPSPARRARQVWAGWVVLALGTAPRIWAAIWDQSLYWPDEIFQTLEQAHRVAFGYGMLPWEFRDAARSWVFPGAIGIFWKLMSALGVSHALGLVISAKLLMVVFGRVGIGLGRRLAEKLAGPNAGLVAALFLAACPLELYFGARVMTEMASGPLLLAGAYFALVATTRRPALAGALASLAIFLR